MISLTHAITGLVLGEIFLLNAPLVVLGAIIPDIDFLIGLPHRGFTHSLFFALTSSFIVYKIFNKRIGFSLFMGLISHLFLDSLTIMGIQLFWPIDIYFSLNLVSASYAPANIFIIALMLVVYYNKNSIIKYLNSLRKGAALKAFFAFVTAWIVLLAINPANVCCTGTICSDISTYTSRSGNTYQVFMLCNENESIKIFKGSWILENDLRKGDLIYLCGTYTTEFGEPEINNIKYVRLIA